MKHLNKSFVAFLSLVFFLTSYNSAYSQTSNHDNVVNSKYSIASSEYEDLVSTALMHIAKFEFDQLSKLVSDDIEYYLPDGGENSRTRFIGKKDFMNFWNTYQEKTGLDSWKVSNIVSIPINIHQKLAYSKIDGVAVTSYFSLESKFGEEEVDVRANWAFHFNENKKIDKIYSYYDRTGLIKAAKLNVLKMKSK